MIVKIIKNALSVVYNNAKSKLTATNVQDAIDEITTIQNGLLVTVDKSSWIINDDSEYVSNITVTGLSGNEMLDVDLYDDGTATEAQIELFDNIVEISTSKDTIKLTSLIQPTVNITLAIRGKFSVDITNYLDAINKINELNTKYKTLIDNLDANYQKKFNDINEMNTISEITITPKDNVTENSSSCYRDGTEVHLNWIAISKSASPITKGTWTEIGTISAEYAPKKTIRGTTVFGVTASIPTPTAGFTRITSDGSIQVYSLASNLSGQSITVDVSYFMQGDGGATTSDETQ